MKRVILFLILAVIALPIFSQDNDKVKVKELGISFSNLDNFGITYKTGHTKALWRINTLLLTQYKLEEVADSLETLRDAIGFGIKFGREWRKEIATNFEMRYGVDLSFTYTQSKSETKDYSISERDMLDKQYLFQPGVNFVFGFNYVIKEKFVIGAEILPYVSYVTGETTRMNFYNNDGHEIKSETSGFRYGISSNSALLTFSYRF